MRSGALTVRLQSSAVLAPRAAASTGSRLPSSERVSSVRLSRVSDSSSRKNSTIAEASRVSEYSPARRTPAPSTRESKRCSRRRRIAAVGRRFCPEPGGSIAATTCSNTSTSAGSSNAESCPSRALRWSAARKQRSAVSSSRRTFRSRSARNVRCGSDVSFDTAARGRRLYDTAPGPARRGAPAYRPGRTKGAIDAQRGEALGRVRGAPPPRTAKAPTIETGRRRHAAFSFTKPPPCRRRSVPALHTQAIASGETNVVADDVVAEPSERTRSVRALVDVETSGLTVALVAHL